MKKYLSLFLIFFFMGSAIAAPKNVFKIDATRNATTHNNLGVNYLNENDYYSAIKEFEMAIMINPNTQASATYYNNLGKTYLKIGYPNLAEKSFKAALKHDAANFEYYQNIVQTYKEQKKLKNEFEKAMKTNNPHSRVIAGLILIEEGKKEPGINMLDEFCFDEPEMILSKGVKEYLKSMAPNNLR